MKNAEYIAKYGYVDTASVSSIYFYNRYKLSFGRNVSYIGFVESQKRKKNLGL